MQPTPNQDKALWREWARAKRQEINPQLPELSGQICEQVQHFLQARNIKTVLAYHALAGEIDIAALQPSFRLLTTRAHFATRTLSLHAWESATEYSKQGILQPPLGTPQVSLSEVEAVLLPALAFDRAGVRLGYGGGFYDRLLDHWRGLTLGVIPAALLVEQLPSEAHDIHAQWLVTETETTPVTE